MRRAANTSSSATTGETRTVLSDDVHRGVSNGDHHASHPAVPGKATKRRKAQSARRKSSFCYRIYVRWFQGVGNQFFGSLFFVVLLWYLLGVVSIATSKLLLTTTTVSSNRDRSVAVVGGVSPLYLTLQQLLIGSTLLHFLLRMRILGTAGVVPWSALSSATDAPRRLYGVPAAPRASKTMFPNNYSYQPSLVMAGLAFSLGFLATNSGFSGSSAAFVETIKAAEPITSAIVAVSWGIEVLSQQEIASLGTIVAGVLLSTLGHSSSAKDDASHQDSGGGMWASTKACVIVMIANLCFSFRGLYQKLFRASPEGNKAVVDDLNLQYRIQQIGVVLLTLPVLILDGPSILAGLWRLSTRDGLFSNGTLVRYLFLSIINGFAFTSYNLASTYVLSRISVVHHAALNCVRRIFAIVVTSVVFAVPITFMGAIGICVTLVGFLRFTHFKVQRQKQPKPVSSLLPVSAADGSAD